MDQFDTFYERKEWSVTRVLYLLAMLSAASHFFFRRYEPTATYYLYSQAGLVVLIRVLGSVPYATGVLIVTLFNLFLGAQIVFYRLVWHDLRAFPGPKLAAITQGWILREAYIGRTRFTMKELAEKYGDWVRIGPNELYTTNIEALLNIMGPKGWPKGNSYDSGLTKEDAGGDSLLTLKSLSEHAARRRIWDKAFTPKAILGYLPSLEVRIEQMLNNFDHCISQGKDIDLCLQIGYFVYDRWNVSPLAKKLSQLQAMCDMAFGAVGGTNLLKSQHDEHQILEQMGRVVRQVGIVRNMPWLTPIVKAWPNPQRREQLNFRNFTKSMFLRRWKQGTGTQVDVFHYLLGEDTETETRLTASELAADSALIVITGADTTRTVLIALFLYLLRYPNHMKKLQAELAASPDLSPTSLSRAHYLNACLQEAMRLQPPSPSNLQRVCPTGGAVIDGKYIPSGTKVRFSNYAMQRNGRYFENPEDFCPERWLKPTQNEHAQFRGEKTRHNEKAFFPFLIGPGACVAKNLAWLEMRLVVAHLLTNYNLSFGTGFDSVAFEQTWSDAYLLLIDQPLWVTLRPKSACAS
ncbi:hypothetical protein O181_016516 [Austropuccinia psidii MF-1]|uniref:Cytochrome P450 n=1 Tax=Austropuccinia psidii MF-1 TaxID=1389203 RepID=A0A9Q3GR43_9BASI|nr:hypothetical protein [Austropuccinia psidii MF-1]